MAKLIPPDPARCQAEIPNGANFMSFGGRPRRVRCSEIPTRIVTEKQAGADGQHGAMSLCQGCWKTFRRQCPNRAVTVAPALAQTKEQLLERARLGENYYDRENAAFEADICHVFRVPSDKVDDFVGLAWSRGGSMEEVVEYAEWLSVLLE